jgi:hypothetical protein
MILWLLLYTQFALAQDDPAIEEYCFSSVGKMKEVSARLKFILVPADKTQEDQNCFTVSTPVHRRELIQNYIRRLEPAVQIGFSSAEIRRPPCNIRVEKIKTRTQQSIGGGLSTGLIPSAGTNQATGESKDVTTIQTLKEFELTVNQDVVKGECRAINPSRYEISLEVRKDAIPLLPPIPPGTIVVVPDAQIPKVQETSRLQTTLQLNSGQRIEIGSVVKNLKDDASSLDINSGAAIEKTTGTQHEKVFLSIE